MIWLAGADPAGIPDPCPDELAGDVHTVDDEDEGGRPMVRQAPTG